MQDKKKTGGIVGALVKCNERTIGFNSPSFYQWLQLAGGEGGPGGQGSLSWGRAFVGCTLGRGKKHLSNETPFKDKNINCTFYALGDEKRLISVTEIK